MVKVALITPWKVKCGIASYSEALSKNLAEKDMDVYIIRLPRFGRKSAPIFDQVVNKIPVLDMDLIHVQHEYGLFNRHEATFYNRLKRLGKPIVSTMHAVGNSGIDRAIANASDKMIVHNEFCKKRLKLDSEVIPHGCKPSETMPCGFISSYKGLETLIEAVSKIPHSALLIGGGWHTEQETHYIATLNQMTQELLPDRCKWLGFVPDEELAMAYGAMDVVVYPSIFSTESGALLMALSHGKAVIANRLPPFKEKEKLGALTTFRGVNSLVKKIRLLLKDEEYRASLEEGARDYAEANTWSKVADKHVNLYKTVLEKV